jgi:hypothetical protein
LYLFLETGFKISVDGKDAISRGVVLTGSMDSPAKADVQGFTHHNGNYGCSFCLNPGVNVSTENKKKSTVHVYKAMDCPDRTQEGTIAAAKEASRTGEYVRKILNQFFPSLASCSSGFILTLSFSFLSKVLGVRYPSIFLLGYPIIWIFPVDYMHAVCLGVAKKLTTLWFDPKYSSFPWTLKDKVPQIDAALRSVRPPRDIKRLPRSIKERQHWKGKSILLCSSDSSYFVLMFYLPLLILASEYRSWLLYFAPVLLESHLPRLYHDHLLLLVSALHVLLSNHIIEKTLSEAETNLNAFSQVYERIYGLALLLLLLLLLLILSCLNYFLSFFLFSQFLKSLSFF